MTFCLMTAMRRSVNTIEDSSPYNVSDATWILDRDARVTDRVEQPRSACRRCITLRSLLHYSERMTIRIVEERHPQIVIVHLRCEMRSMREYDPTPLQFLHSQRDVCAAKIYDATLAWGRSVVGLLKEQSDTCAIEKGQVSEAVEFSQSNDILIKIFRPIDIADGSSDLSDVAQI
jgi:hypothetical protein